MCVVRDGMVWCGVGVACAGALMRDGAPRHQHRIASLPPSTCIASLPPSTCIASLASNRVPIASTAPCTGASSQGGEGTSCPPMHPHTLSVGPWYPRLDDTTRLAISDNKMCHTTRLAISDNKMCHTTRLAISDNKMCHTTRLAIGGTLAMVPDMVPDMVLGMVPDMGGHGGALLCSQWLETSSTNCSTKPHHAARPMAHRHSSSTSLHCIACTAYSTPSTCLLGGTQRGLLALPALLRLRLLRLCLLLHLRCRCLHQASSVPSLHSSPGPHGAGHSMGQGTAWGRARHGAGHSMGQGTAWGTARHGAGHGTP